MIYRDLSKIAPNLQRASEIARAGSHSIRVISGSENVKAQDIELLCKFYEIENKVGGADINVGIFYSTEEILNVFDLSFLDKSCKTLLKTATARLSLGICNVASILNVAKTIADTSPVKAEHIAEAINYQTVDL